jgi:hypothetical protein
VNQVLLNTFNSLNKLGLSCDFNTGLCQRFRIPDGFQLFDNWNKCEFVKCPDGYKCDGTSGICTRKSSQVLLANDYCDGIECPPDFSCITGYTHL